MGEDDTLKNKHWCLSNATYPEKDGGGTLQPQTICTGSVPTILGWESSQAACYSHNRALTLSEKSHPILARLDSALFPRRHVPQHGTSRRGAGPIPPHGLTQEQAARQDPSVG